MDLDGNSDILVQYYRTSLIAKMQNNFVLFEKDSVRAASVNGSNYGEDSTYAMLPFDFDNDCKVELIIGKQVKVVLVRIHYC